MTRKDYLGQIYRRLDKLILIILLGLVGLFILWPVIAIVAKSFQYDGQVSFHYYRDIFSPRNRHLIWNSLWTTFASSSISTLVGVCIVLFSFLSRSGLKKILERGIMLAMISPPFVSALAYITLFGRRGLITYGWLGLSVNPYGAQSIIILQSLGGIAFASLMLLVNLQQVDVFQLMASQDLGAKGTTTLRKIVLPALLPGIYSVFFVLFTMNLADFGTPIVVGGSFKVLATEAYLQAVSTPHLGKAAAISVLMVPSALIAFFFYRRNMRFTQSQGAQKLSLQADDYRLSVPGWLRGLLGGISLSYFSIILLKYGNIILSAFSNTSLGKIKWTLDNMHNFSRSNAASLSRSLMFSIIAGLAAGLIGILIAWYTHRRRLPGMGAVEFVTSLPYVIPGTFFGLGYVAAFSRQPLLLRGTPLILIANYTFRQLTVSIKAANTSFSGLSENIDQASKDLGASELETFAKVLLPSLRSVFLSSFITVFTASMTAVGAIAFLVAPGMNVASMELFKFVEQGRYGLASFHAFLMMICIISLNLMVLWIKDILLRRSAG